MIDDDLRLPEVMPLGAAAELLGCSVRTLERARDADELRASQLAGRGCWVVTRESLLAWIKAREVAPAGRPILPATGPTRASARAALGVSRRGQRPGPLKVTADMGRRAA